MAANGRRSKARRAATTLAMGTAASDSAVTVANATAAITTGTARSGNNNVAAISAKGPVKGPQARPITRSQGRHDVGPDVY